MNSKIDSRYSSYYRIDYFLNNLLIKNEELLVNRFKQEFLNKILYDFLKLDNKKKNFKNFKFNLDLENNKIKVNFFYFIFNITLYISLIIFSPFIFFFSYFKNFFILNKKFILLYGIPQNYYKNKSNIGFNIFLNKFFKSNIDNYYLIKRQEFLSLKKNRVIFVKDPLIYLFFNSKLTLSDFKKFLLDITHYSLLFFKLIKYKPFCILALDFLLLPYAKVLFEKKLINECSITNTNWTKQYLWMQILDRYGIKFTMHLYSLNTSTFMTNDNKFEVYHPSLKYLKVDKIFVWHHFYIKTLSKIGIKSNFKINDPFIPFEKNSSKNYFSKIYKDYLKIFVVDVVPQSDSWMKKYNVLNYYYCFNNNYKFWNDIKITLTKFTNKKIIIYYKSKREKSVEQEAKIKKYFEGTGILVKFFSPEYSLKKIIEGVNITISMPFSSPSILALLLKTKCMYYDSSGLLINNYISDSLVPLVSNEVKLFSILKKYIN
jgi:polysaccharide biosynthesis PFTS motif protein